MDLTPDLEQRRRPASGGGERWFEGHRLELFTGSGADRRMIALSVVAEPSVAEVSFTAVVLRSGHFPVVVAEDDVPLPERGWELRASGLWADHICETPFDHWSYGLEAFGLALDDPDALLGRAFGERAPLGWELEFEADGEPEWETTEEYRQRGIGHGLLLDASGQVEVEGSAVRTHWWGGTPPERLLVGEAPVDWPEPVSRVSVPSREAVWRYALWGAGASSSSIDA